VARRGVATHDWTRDAEIIGQRKGRDCVSGEAAKAQAEVCAADARVGRTSSVL